MAFADFFWTAAYVIAFFGSVSFGYLILRFSMPDVRARSREQKLGLSGVIGVLLFAASYGLSLLVSVHTFIFFLPLTTLVLSAFFETRNMFFAKTELQVAIPVARVERREVEYAIPAKRATAPPRIIEEGRITEKGVQITRPAAPPAPPAVPAKRGRERRETVSREAPPAAPPAMSERRRRYLARRGLLTEEAREDLLRAAERKPEVAPPPELEKPTVSLEEIAGGIDVSALEKISSAEELGELGEVSSLDVLEKMELGELGGVSELENMPKEKGMACPKCGSAKGMMVYCPYDGKGFCTNCADKIETKQDLLFMACPHCTKEVIVKKP